METTLARPPAKKELEIRNKTRNSSKPVTYHQGRLKGPRSLFGVVFAGPEVFNRAVLGRLRCNRWRCLVWNDRYVIRRFLASNHALPKRDYSSVRYCVVLSACASTESWSLEILLCSYHYPTSISSLKVVASLRLLLITFTSSLKSSICLEIITTMIQ